MSYIQGCDIPHVKRVIQFTVPKSLDIWLQQGGQAGRDRSIQAEAILLVQPSVFQEISSKKGISSPETDGTTDTPQYRKEIHGGLRQWIEATECRRDVVDVYYDSGVPRSSKFDSSIIKKTSTYTCEKCRSVSVATTVNRRQTRRPMRISRTLMC